MPWIIRIIVSAFAVIISSYLLPGVHVDGFLTALLVAAILSLLNAFLRPILILLTIPITFVTMGLFLLVINAFMIIITDHLLDGFSVKNFWWALLFSLVLTLVTDLLDKLNERMK
ncbi:MAG: phage holin family protein [Bacteroidota bacterium]